MTVFEWDHSIALGIPVIDRQHKALFGWLNSLNEAILKGYGHEKVEQTIYNLISYATVHFSDEERMMESYSYPQLSSHRKEHDQFVIRLQAIQAGFIAGQKIENKVLDFMVEWLVSHIKGTDQDYSRFIHEQ